MGPSRQINFIINVNVMIRLKYHYADAELTQPGVAIYWYPSV